MKQWVKKVFLGVTIGLAISFAVLAAGFVYLGRLPAPKRVNALVLGITGEESAGGDLTDTIIFVSADRQAGKVVTVSLPRDVWIAPIRARINTAYHYGGMDLAKSTVVEVLGQPIDYAVLIDSALFVDLIDVLGGVEVDVERGFDDYRYPIPGKENDLCDGDPEFKCRYEHLHFEAGDQEMSGEQALKYIRSRHAEGEEGTDFARNRRQQRLLLAIKEKILSFQILFSPRKILQLFKAVMVNVKTDVPQERYAELLRMALKFRLKDFKTHGLDEELFISPPASIERYDNQWVLVPKAGDWSEIQDYVARLLEE